MKFAQSKLSRVLPFMFVIGGVIGLISSFIISLDKIKILENPNYVPSCNLNPIISCGSVMRSHQGSIFGFPNPWMGLVGFGILICVGMAMFAGASFKRWFWWLLDIGVDLGIIFAYWLLFESVYRIHALCPYCLTVDVVVITLAWYLKLQQLETGMIALPKGKFWQWYKTFSRRHHLDILMLWFLILFGLIVKHFWYYFGHNF